MWPRVWNATILVYLFLTASPAFALDLWKVRLEQEIKTGEKVFKGMDETFPICTDPIVNERIQKIVERVKPHSLRPELPWEVRVYDYSTPQIYNAYAAGSQIRIHRELMEALSDDQLATLIGHERAHVDLKHMIKGWKRDVLLNILTGNDPSILESLAASLISFSYSRDQEREADRLGLRYAYLAGYDPRGMISLFLKLQKISPSLPRTLSYLSTHPSTKDRLSEVRTLAAETILELGHRRPTDKTRIVTVKVSPKNRYGLDFSAEIQQKTAHLLEQSSQYKMAQKDELVRYQRMIERANTTDPLFEPLLHGEITIWQLKINLSQLEISRSQVANFGEVPIAKIQVNGKISISLLNLYGTEVQQKDFPVNWQGPTQPEKFKSWIDQVAREIALSLIDYDILYLPGETSSSQAPSL